MKTKKLISLNMEDLKSQEILKNIAQIIDIIFPDDEVTNAYKDKFLPSIPKDPYRKMLFFGAYISGIDKLESTPIPDKLRGYNLEKVKMSLKSQVTNLYFAVFDELGEVIDAMQDLLKLEEYNETVKCNMKGMYDRRSNKIIRNPFAKSLLELVQDELEWINEKIETKLNLSDDRIDGNLMNEEIIEYFMKLKEPHKDNRPILKEDQIMNLLHANFKGFEPRKEIKKFDTPNCKQISLRRFVYKFNHIHNPTNRTDEYIHFLQDNFSIFDGSEFDTIKKSFSR